MLCCGRSLFFVNNYHTFPLCLPLHIIPLLVYNALYICLYTHTRTRVGARVGALICACIQYISLFYSPAPCVSHYTRLAVLSSASFFFLSDHPSQSYVYFISAFSLYLSEPSLFLSRSIRCDVVVSGADSNRIRTRTNVLHRSSIGRFVCRSRW